MLKRMKRNVSTEQKTLNDDDRSLKAEIPLQTGRQEIVGQMPQRVAPPPPPTRRPVQRADAPQSAPSRATSSDQETLAGGGGNLVRMFLVLAVLPTIFMGLYLFFVASPQYVSEARVVVRTAQDDKGSADFSDALSMLSRMSGGSANKASIADAYIVSDYVRSRSIIMKIGGETALDTYFGKNSIDYFSRLTSSQPIEIGWKYWQSMVSSSVDTQSSIISLTARAFNPDDAHRLLRSILSACENKLNELSLRARDDMINRAVADRDKAAERLKNARAALLDFQSRNRSIDPTADARQLGSILAQLTLERIETENEMLTSSSSLNATSPTRRLLTTRIQAIDTQIADIQKKLTSDGGSKPISQLLSKYEELQLELRFAERLYSSAESGISVARLQADRQQLYLAEIVSPTVPQYALYPKSALMTLFTFIAGTAAWMFVALLLAGIRDHMI